MVQSSDSNQKICKDLLDEIDKARLEIELSEKTFQWAENDPEAIDLAITRKRAAVEHFNFLIKQAKKINLKLEKEDLINRV
ncbi:MAG: DUF2508 family protein, partial [Clostridia bacterium]|nr:DUF2508 family protein [Clostridia bacterium]